MDPLDFLEPAQLLIFFRRHKTELSCLKNPRTFINQLRDHNLIPEDRYKKMIRMKSENNMKQALYEVLDWLEREQSGHITRFWTCVFKETIINNYPTLRLLRNSLLDGSFQFDSQLPEKVGKGDTEKGKRNGLSGDEEEGETETNSVKKKRKLRSSGLLEEEQASTSAPSTPGQRKKSKKIHFSSPLKKGEKEDIWNWPIYRLQLPVTCGNVEGMLDRDKLAKGEKCVQHDKRWFTPSDFESLAGKQSCRNWKMSIRCRSATLGKLIQEGHLKSIRCKIKGRCKKAKKSLFQSVESTTETEGENEDGNEAPRSEQENQSASTGKQSSTEITDEEGEAEKQPEQQPEASHDGGKTFNVTCGALAGTLHKKRFVSGTCGKSIRTEMSWMTPVEFMEAASCESDASWRKDITCEGKPLSDLTASNVLGIHSLLCTCPKCTPDPQDLEHQKNDDECFICKSEQEPFVVCDQCPRSFHQNCHLPCIEDAIIGDDRLWMCTFCVYKSNQACFYRDELTREAAMARQISQHMLVCQYLLLLLYSADQQQIFATNPSLHIRDYSTVINTPMWLSNIAEKLQGQSYQTVGEFESDVQLIFSNCATYNRENAEFLTMGRRLKNIFDKELKNVLNICD
ncbi:nuclear body protein SP140-like [Brachionichthys hirsutus]|uniref:nuclear body protein SP140-like n=1 Tax=Brachionichthys hirsutus TaxID=412623 RepID=UPI0036051390